MFHHSKSWIFFCLFLKYPVFTKLWSEMKVKVHIFWEGHKILRNFHRRFDRYYIHMTNLRWRFRKILWPSQNIWTLTYCADDLVLLLLILKHPSQHNSTLEAKLVAWNYFNVEKILRNWLCKQLCKIYGQSFVIFWCSITLLYQK